MRKTVKSHKTHRAATAPATQARPEQALKATIEQAAEALAAELRAGKSERFMALLAFAARFHHYSFGNQILIATQCPGATHVAGYKAWERMGYHVAKGQHGIRILAPRPYTRTREVNEPGVEGATEIRAGIYFASIAVFDASQLSPEDVAAKPLPEFYYSLGSDADTEALCGRVVAAMTAAGIEVVERNDLGAGVQGESAGGRVAIRADLASRNAFKTLVHEWAHELLHQGADAEARGADRGIRECHAEAVSYIVCARFGMHNPFSADYLQSWGNTADTLMAELATVQKAAAAIIGALEPRAERDEAD